MPLTRDFKETVQEMLRTRPGYAAALLREGVDAFLGGEMELGKALLRDYINGTIGFARLSRKVKIPTKSLMRMFGSSGNPQAKNLFAVIDALRRDAGIDLHLAAE